MTQKIGEGKKNFNIANYDNYSSNSASSKEATKTPTKKESFNRLIQTKASTN
jgi:hypothetical protein